MAAKTAACFFNVNKPQSKEIVLTEVGNIPLTDGIHTITERQGSSVCKITKS